MLVENAKPVEFGQKLFAVRVEVTSPAARCGAGKYRVMFDKILIANRGEIAVRIIRACKELGIRTVAVYSQADADSLHVQLADEAICIGAAPSTESYLKIDRIISAAEVGDVEAIHPGYGFLAENAHFAEVCENCNIKFIGPSSAAIRAMGDKVAARETMRKAGRADRARAATARWRLKQEALKIARKIGYPVIIKAAGGGGGRGMRVAHNDLSLVKGFHTARPRPNAPLATRRFTSKNTSKSPRHIEFQILADRKGQDRSISANAIAASSAATRSSSRNPRRRS